MSHRWQYTTIVMLFIWCAVWSLSVEAHQDPCHGTFGTVGATVVRVNTNWPFCGVGRGPLLPATLTAVS